MVEPGLGTAVGAVGGGLIGGFGGFGGGLFNTMSGATKPDERWKGEADRSYQQQANIDQLHDWAYSNRKDQYGNPLYGSMPSAAQDMVNRNRAVNADRAMATSKAMSGGNPALAAQLANRQVMQGNADAGFQGAMLRSQEQQQAMAAYQAALERNRQQEIEKAKALNEVDSKNAEKKSSFIGSLMGGAGNMMGGMI